jgi:Mce-associated membrane protein
MSATLRADRWVRSATAAIIVLGLVAAALGIAVHGEHVSEQRQSEAKAAAAKSVPAILSYRPTTVESELTRERALLGKPFADEFATLVHDVIAPKAKQRGITTRATVVSNGVSLIDGRTVTLLMFVNVATTERASKEPVVTGSRLKVTVRQDDRRWRIIGLDPV